MSESNSFFSGIEDIDVFHKIPEIPEKCRGCPVAESLRDSAQQRRSLGEVFYKAFADGLDDKVIDEILNEESFDKEGLEELLADGVDIDGVLVSNLDGFLREFKKYRGENVAQLIDQANDETKEYTNLLEACANSGPTSHVLPRDLGRRPVRASFCTGAVNSVSFQDPNATIVFFEEID